MGRVTGVQSKVSRLFALYSTNKTAKKTNAIIVHSEVNYSKVKIDCEMPCRIHNEFRKLFTMRLHSNVTYVLESVQER